jgi:hypothetical protein
LVREEFDSLLDPDSFTDDGNTVLSAELVDIAMSFSSRGDSLASVSEYFNSALTKRKAETMQSWWYDNAVYRTCLTDLVGDDAWSKLKFEEKLPLLSDRSEFCKVRAQEVEDITDRVFADAILGDTAAINLALALGVDSSRVLYRRFMDGICDTGQITGISLDWTHLTAKHLGEGQSEKWLLTVVDQQQRLIGAWFTANTALSTAKPILMQLKKNGCKPVVVALDNLPPAINRDTGMVRFLKATRCSYWVNRMHADLEADLTRQSRSHHCRPTRGKRQHRRAVLPLDREPGTATRAFIPPTPPLPPTATTARALWQER